MNGIIVDKSYLRGKKGDQIASLGSSYSILMPECLLYEIVKSEGKERAMLLNKFPKGNSPFHMIPDFGAFLRMELRSHKAVGMPSSHVRSPVDYSRNAKFMDENYSLDAMERSVVDKMRADATADANNFILLSQEFLKNYPEISTGSDQSRKIAAEELRTKVSREKDYVRRLYSTIKITHPNLAGLKAPNPTIVDVDWASYRWVQIMTLFSIDIGSRYSNINILSALPENTIEKIRHDVMDFQYLLLGLLEGRFATTEGKLIDWYRLLSPSGVLLT